MSALVISVIVTVQDSESVMKLQRLVIFVKLKSTHLMVLKAPSTLVLQKLNVLGSFHLRMSSMPSPNQETQDMIQL